MLPGNGVPRLSRANLEALAIAESLQVQDAARAGKMSRSECSMARVEAIGKLDTVGLSTWDLRQIEKVTKYHALQGLGGSIWGQFFGWQDDMAAVDTD